MMNAPRPRRLAAGMMLLVAAALVLAIGGGSRVEADSAPAKKDTSSRIPKKATAAASVEPTTAKAGESVTYRVTVKVEDPWHIYNTSKEEVEGGPMFTSFDFFERGGLEAVGDWTPSREPIRKKEDVFPNLDVLEYFEGEVTWSIELRIPPGAKPGPQALRSQITYQLCDPKSCMPPVRQTLPEVVLTVEAGGEAAPAAAASPAPAAPAGDAPSIAAAPAPPADAPADAPKAPISEVERELERGLIPFLLLSAAGGLLALVMPCVWPMVPITVNFFVKQGQARNGGSTTGLAITYCLAIIGIFTLVGVLFSALFGASAAQNLATNAWFNLAIALLFVAFGLSLLGLFELRLPNFLLNASAQGESKGGLIGVIFMALTLTITSFSCTFPVVGGLLVMAARGSYLYPVIGLMTFATVLALPFFVLALSPGLLSKMPRSGDWMNAVKVVGGLIELGAAVKFLNNAEIGFGTPPADAWTNAPATLAIWVVLALVCGVYLLGLFRTDHDHDEVKVGPFRILFGTAFIFLALFLSPALFGQPPRSQIWNRLIVGLLPPDYESLAPAYAVAAGPGGGGDGHGSREATSTDPEVALREQVSFHGVPWTWSFDGALERAKAEGKPVLVDFTGVFCVNCRLMEQSVMPRPEIVQLLKEFVTVQLYTDQVPIRSLPKAERDRLAEENQVRQAELVQDVSNPFYVVLSPDGSVLQSIGGYREPSVFAGFLQRGLEQHAAAAGRVDAAITAR